jgi:hypothetical protein
MVKYKNSKIYTITSPKTNVVYIGYTTQYLSIKLSSHRRDYKLYKNNKKSYDKLYDIICYDDYKIILIEKYSCNNKSQLMERFNEIKKKYENIENNSNKIDNNSNNIKKPQLTIYNDVEINEVEINDVEINDIEINDIEINDIQHIENYNKINCLKMSNKINRNYTCNKCNLSYKHYPSLCRHRKNCLGIIKNNTNNMYNNNTNNYNYNNSNNSYNNSNYNYNNYNNYNNSNNNYNHNKYYSYDDNDNINIGDSYKKNIDSDDKTHNISPEQIISLINENKYLKDILIKQLEEKDKIIKELIPQVGNKTQNNFNIKNINMFLNDKCKDAISINEFISNINITVPNLLYTKDNGIANGISNIFMENMNKLSIYERPIHCTDLKREVLYIKNDTWEKDENKKQFKEAIIRISKIQSQNVRKWNKENPEFMDNDSKKDEFVKLVKNTMECIDDVKENKIIKSICKEIYINDKLIEE